jgi:hypothetical protein
MRAVLSCCAAPAAPQTTPEDPHNHRWLFSEWAALRRHRAKNRQGRQPPLGYLAPGPMGPAGSEAPVNRPAQQPQSGGGTRETVPAQVAAFAVTVRAARADVGAANAGARRGLVQRFGLQRPRSKPVRLELFDPAHYGWEELPGAGNKRSARTRLRISPSCCSDGTAIKKRRSIRRFNLRSSAVGPVDTGRCAS